jgi:hypothetical protein
MVASFREGKLISGPLVLLTIGLPQRLVCFNTIFVVRHVPQRCGRSLTWDVSGSGRGRFKILSRHFHAASKAEHDRPTGWLVLRPDARQIGLALG